MVSGNYDMARCVRDAVSEIGSSGIRIVEGKTPKGSSLYRRDGELRTTYSSRRSYPLDAAIRRDLTTQMNRSCAELALADCDKVGTRLVQTSWHIGARPEHERWQGKVFSLDRDPTETASNAEDVDRLNATLRNALRKTTIDENVRAYRSAGSIEGFSKRMGIPPGDLMDNEKNIGLKGIRFKDEAFLSISIFPDHTLYNKTVMMDVLVPRGTHGMYIQPISKYPKQYELLLQSGRELLIQNVEYREGILHLVVVVKN